jgi:NTP pyrophosphatase (non-canonical NTP hydrolase)
MANQDLEGARQYLTLAAYESRAWKANQFKGSPDAIDQLRFGFFGEIGGLLASVKKSHRDLGTAEKLTAVEELGDALWYLTVVAVEYELKLEAVGRSAIEELQRRLGLQDAAAITDKPLTFTEIDGLMAFCRGRLNQPISTLLNQLAARAGLLLGATNGAGDLGSHPPVTLLPQLLADMVMVAATYELAFTKVAADNLKKFESRWPDDGAEYRPLFDAGRNEFERFPPKLEMRFIELQTPDGQPYVIQQLHGINIGDRLTDNREEEDGYRFHDVFHLAYLAHLGWSPVIRGLLKLKRKSDKNLDENQDGARAMIIEEGIATWIFNHASQNKYYSETRAGRLNYGLLKQVLDMVYGYEVHDCPLWQWERAILDGFTVFRQLREARCGAVHVDLVAHTIEFKAIEPPSIPSFVPKTKRAPTIGAALPVSLTSSSDLK